VARRRMALAGADARDPDNEWRTHQPVRVIPATNGARTNRCA